MTKLTKIVVIAKYILKMVQILWQNVKVPEEMKMSIIKHFVKNVTKDLRIADQYLF